MADQIQEEPTRRHPNPYSQGLDWMHSGLFSVGFAGLPACEPSQRPELQHVKEFFVRMQAMRHE